jgi:hypothetical protein
MPGPGRQRIQDWGWSPQEGQRGTPRRRRSWGQNPVPSGQEESGPGNQEGVGAGSQPSWGPWNCLYLVGVVRTGRASKVRLRLETVGGASVAGKRASSP